MSVRSSNTGGREPIPVDGEAAVTLFGKGEGLTYNDFIILPGRISFTLEKVGLSTRITRRIKLQNPIASSPMDTVTTESFRFG